MAFARLLFRVLLILLILLAVIGLMLPSSAQVERSTLINAPAGAIFPHLDGMRAFHAWSPWSDIDPNTQYLFEGPDQGVGSRMTWQSGHNQVGQGSQEITAIVPDRRVEMQLEFGDKGSGSATFLLEPEGPATRIRWQFITAFGWDLFGRYVGLMLDSMIGTSYDKGLKALKSRVENKSPTASSPPRIPPNQGRQYKN
jgi:uncharacterized protein YndB with AHSA1/START domain